MFDQNVEEVKKKLPPPLSFKLGTGKGISVQILLLTIHSNSRSNNLIYVVINLQWDEGILTMSKGEKAKFVIEPEWVLPCSLLTTRLMERKEYLM